MHDLERELQRELRRLDEEKLLAPPAGNPGQCRYCAKAVATTFCPTCGARCIGHAFDTLADCLIPRIELHRLKRATIEAQRLDTLEGDIAAEEYDAALNAAVDINRMVLLVAQARRKREYHELDMIDRDQMEQWLHDLRPAGLNNLASAIWSLVSDCERQQAEWELLRDFEDQRARAREYTWRERWKPAFENWKLVLMWLADNRHPDHAAMLAEAEKEVEQAKSALAGTKPARAKAAKPAAPIDAPLF